MKNFIAIVILLSSSLSLAKKSEMTIQGRRFVVVSPNTRPTVKRPLLLLLHGCKQTPEIILEGTRLDQVAVDKNFFVIAPQQSVLENFDRCWNWFLAYEQNRIPTNQMGQMVAAVTAMILSSQVDPNEIYIAGMSAGGVMGHNLASCYPDVFRGAALSAGLAYKIAEDLYEASTVLEANHFKSPNYLGKAAYSCGRVGGKRRLDKMLLIHGQEDKRVDPFHSKLISDVNEITLDYYDDGRKNNSATYTSIETFQDLQNNFGASIKDKRYQTVKFTERLIMVEGMGHAWGGGKPISTNFDPKAPSTNEFILNFFQL